MSQVIDIKGRIASAQRQYWLDVATDTIMDSLVGLKDAVRVTIEEELSEQSLRALQSGEIEITPILDVHIDTGDKSLRTGLRPPLPLGDGGSAG